MKALLIIFILKKKFYMSSIFPRTPQQIMIVERKKKHTL